MVRRINVTLLLILMVTSVFLVSTALTLPGAYAASGQLLYGCAHTGAGTGVPGPSTLYTINPSTGAATAIGPMGINGCSALAVASNGVVYAEGIDQSTNDYSLFTVNLATGAATLVGRSDQVSCGNPVSGLSFRPSDGVLFAMGAFGCAGTINTSTGVFTGLGHCALSGTYPTSCTATDGNVIGFSSSNVLWYSECCNQGPQKTSLYGLNQVTGIATLVLTLSGFPAGCTTVENDPTGFAFDSSGTLFSALKCDSGHPPAFYLATLNTGVLTVIGPTVTGLGGIAWVNAPSTECVTASTGGLVCFAADAGGFTSLTASALSSISPAPPGGLTFPFGLFSFTVQGLTSGETVHVTMTLPSPLPAGAFAYYKFQSGVWAPFPGALLDSTRTIITLTLTADSSGNINDPGGPAIGTPTQPATHPLNVGGEMLPVNLAQVLGPWVAVMLALGVVAVETLLVKRKKFQRNR